MTAQIAAYGRLARDPRQHGTRTGNPLTTGTIAVEVEARGGDDGDDGTLWLRVVAFGRGADDLARHAKGDPVSVVGRLQLTRYQTPTCRHGPMPMSRSTTTCRSDPVPACQSGSNANFPWSGP